MCTRLIRWFASTTALVAGGLGAVEAYAQCVPVYTGTTFGAYATVGGGYTPNYVLQPQVIDRSASCGTGAAGDAKIVAAPYGSSITGANSSLLSGTLGVGASVVPGVGPAPAPAVSGFAQAEFQDYLTLTLPSASDDPNSGNYLTRLDFVWRVHGIWNHSQELAFTNASINSGVILESFRSGSVVKTDQSIVELRGPTSNYAEKRDGTTWNTAPTLGSSTSGRLVKIDDGLWTFRSHILVYGRSPEIRIRSFLNAFTSSIGLIQEVHVDAYQTSAFEFYLPPPDMSFSSASGVFLTSPVPEPSTTSLLILGLLGLSARFFRKVAHPIARSAA